MAVVGEPGEELTMVLKIKVNLQAVAEMEVIIATCTNKEKIVMYLVTWKKPGMS